ncbi:MAG: hypothetical protein EWM73_00444 [Nitrospira sp.]|nr:MAG: hypothetical protein EWM73_00444 [Nitrospira sp.]
MAGGSLLELFPVFSELWMALVMLLLSQGNGRPSLTQSVGESKGKTLRTLAFPWSL